MVKYNIVNDLSHLKEGDIAFSTIDGHVQVTHIDTRGILFTTNDGGSCLVDLSGRTLNKVKHNPVLFESIVTAIGYFSYYYNYMLNDRTIANKYTGV